MKDHSREDEKITCISYVIKGDRWMVDSGCSHHMTGDKSKFQILEFTKGSCVNFCNDAQCIAKGKGSIRLTDKIKCDNAYWVEGLRYNLLSVAQLNSLGY